MQWRFRAAAKKVLNSKKEKLLDESINAVYREFVNKNELFKENDDLCSFNKVFENSSEKSSENSVCKGNLGIERKQMPQIIDSKINFDGVDIELIKKFIELMLKLKTLKNISLNDIKIMTELDLFTRLREISNNYREVLMSFINFCSERSLDEFDRVLNTMITEKASIEAYAEKEQFGESLATVSDSNFEFAALKPTQKEIFSTKSLGIAFYIFEKSLSGLIDKGKTIDEIFEETDKEAPKFFLRVSSSGFPVVEPITALNFMKNLKKNVNYFTKGLLVDEEGYIIDGHHRWSSCKFLQFVLKHFEGKNFFPDNVTVVKKMTSFKKEYYNKMLDNPLIYSLDLNDVLQEKNKFKLDGGSKKSKRRYKRSKKSKRRYKRSKKLKKRKSKKKLL